MRAYLIALLFFYNNREPLASGPQKPEKPFFVDKYAPGPKLLGMPGGGG